MSRVPFKRKVNQAFLHPLKRRTIGKAAIPEPANFYLVDESGNNLVDESGNKLKDQR